MLYVIIAAVALVVGAFAVNTYKVEKACHDSYKVKLLQAKIKNQEISLGYYKSAFENAKKIAEEAKKAEDKDKTESVKIDANINQPKCVNCCIDDGFMRTLQSGR
jgi:cell division protein FtsL